MSFESFIKNARLKIGKTVENIATERERRLNDPAFQRELMNSRNEFVKHLSNTGSHTLDSVYKIFLRGPGVTAWAITRNIFDSKTNFSDHVMPKILDEIASTGSSLGQAVYSATKAAGRGGLHTIRWLFAK